MLDGKISGIQSNFNRLHKLTQAAIQTTKRHRKERIAGEREIENLQHIKQYKQELENTTSKQLASGGNRPAKVVFRKTGCHRA